MPNPLHRRMKHNATTSPLSFTLREEFVELCNLLKLVGIADSGGRGKADGGPRYGSCRRQTGNPQDGKDSCWSACQLQWCSHHRFSSGKMKTKSYDVHPEQSVELLKELHILTRDGKMNQDSRRKLKQVRHLFQFIEPLLKEVLQTKPAVNLVDHGAGKSYLGFILYDLFFKQGSIESHVFGIETRDDLVQKSQALAAQLGFAGMSFLNLSVADFDHLQ